MHLAVTGPDGRWQPGIGDPTPLGWITTVAYLLAAALCLWAWRRETRAAFLGRGSHYVPRFWLLAAAALAALGINKQLDLQSFLTQVGKDVAYNGGWYERRRVVQAAFIGVVGLIGFSSVLAILWWLRGSLRRYRVAIAGLAYIACFVVIRAASFHHIDRLLGTGTAVLRINHVLELGGIALTACGAVSAILGAKAATPARTNRTPSAASRPGT